MGNTFGSIYRLTTFGESHGPAIGGVIDGVPAGLEIDFEAVQYELDRRRPGQSDIVTPRKEEDKVEFLSGIFEGRTTGTPIGFIIRNGNQKSSDYSEMKDLFRPNHADYTFTEKYGIRDYRGGGRSSARETACRIVGGAVARQALENYGIKINAYTAQVGGIRCGEFESFDEREKNPVRCPDPAAAAEMEALIRSVRKAGDTVGGIVGCKISGVPAGFGDPVFDKLQSRLAAAMMSINAAKGFEYGFGFRGVTARGSEVVDNFIPDGNGGIKVLANNSGGIQGGISNGADIYFRVAFKPVATLLMPLETVDKDGNKAVLKARGRHDPCVVPRAVPIVEAMAAMVIFDAMLQNRCARL